MPTVTVLGRECEAKPLSPLELVQWNEHITRTFAASYWVDLYETIKTLPPGVQQVIVGRSPLPAKLDRLQYFRAASTVESVGMLVTWIIVNREITRFQVVDANAAQIFWALQPLILNKPMVVSAGEALAKLREPAEPSTPVHPSRPPPSTPRIHEEADA